LAAFFEALSQEERDVILDPKGTTKLPAKDTNKVLAMSVSPAKAADTEPTQLSKKQQKQKAEDAENDMVCTYSYSELCLAHPIFFN
jgi:chromatin assembly factor 1 subunit A